MDRREDFERVVGGALEHASPVFDRHLRFHDPSGAGVAAHLDEDGSISCVTPFFAPPDGGTVWRVSSSKAALDADCRHCSGADCDVFDGESGEMCTRTTVQWAFFSPFERWLAEQRTYELQLAGFASTLTLCTDEEDLDRTQLLMFGEGDPKSANKPLNSLRLALPAFLPEGMFATSGGITARAMALLTGHVESINERKNEHSGSTFVQVRLQTLGGPLDIVAPHEALLDAPARPRCAIARVWLVGQPANIDLPR